MTVTAWLLAGLVVLLMVSAWGVRRSYWKVIRQLEAEIEERPNIYFVNCEFPHMKKPKSLRLDKIDPGCKALLVFRHDCDEMRMVDRRRIDIHEIAREYADKLLDRANEPWSAELHKQVSDIVNYLAHGRRLK